VYLNDDLGKILTSGEKELITSITSGGAFVGAIAAGLTADRFGRKGAIYMGCLLFIIGAVLQAVSNFQSIVFLNLDASRLLRHFKFRNMQ
jgi:SP family myo-inositol transporter-like MFS transporter 13